jgi:hypothetical protein
MADLLSGGQNVGRQLSPTEIGAVFENPQDRKKANCSPSIIRLAGRSIWKSMAAENSPAMW